MADFAVVGLKDVHMSSLGVFVDAFELVRIQVATLFRTRGTMAMASRVHLLTTDGRPVRMAGGRRLTADGGLDGRSDYDLVHIPAFVVGNEAALDSRLADAGRLCQWLKRQHMAGALVSASGPAVFLLAESGLLHGGIATIARPLIPLFRRRYPGVRVDHRTAVVEFDRVVTASGLGADAQLLTRLVEHTTTPELARWLRDVTGLQQTTAQDLLADDLLTANAQIWLEERFAQAVRIADLASAMAVSQQTLLRHFRRFLDTTPRDYVRRLRMQAAQRLLLRTTRSVDQIAGLVGYNDVHAFRQVFRSYTGTSASKFRTVGKKRL